jgi:hypothetical protein
MRGLRTLGLSALAFAALLAPAPADARIARIDAQIVESPTFGGRSFGAVGQYEKLKGKVYGEVDPRDPRNAVIVDLQHAPRNARGMVEYSSDIWLVRPADQRRGNHRIFFELNNRGGNLSFGQLNDESSGGNDPTTAADAGNGFLMSQGYTILEAGWDISAAPGAGRFTITVPVARNRDGSGITGPSLDEFVIDEPTTAAQPLTYPPASLDQNRASLTWRLRYDDPPQPVPASGWAYGPDGKSISVQPAGTPFQVGLYELAYPAKDPLVAGLGFAAIRDIASRLRKPNPLARDVERVYSFGVSQPARTMHDFVRLGFNRDEHGRQVFDGVLNWIGGASGIFMNHRFAQPARTHRQHIGRWYPEYEFPFANQTLRDPYTGKVDGRLRRCRATHTCPRVIEVNSENEYWAKAGSVLHTDAYGRDLGDAPGVRTYLMSSLPHGVGTGAEGAGICQQVRNPLGANTVLRRLLVDLDEWVSGGSPPPPSRVPRRADGTLVPPLPQEAVGFPDIPGVTYNGVRHTGDLFFFGPRYERGIIDVFPPLLLGSPYPALVPRTDADGNDIAGIRLPDVAVPLATYTGWNLRPSGDGCDAAGMVIPFARTRAERLAKGDPRPSLEERYPDHASYVRAVADAADRLVRERLLLPEDARAYVQRAEESDVGR